MRVQDFRWRKSFAVLDLHSMDLQADSQPAVMLHVQQAFHQGWDQQFGYLIV
jgi:hypothetical protein